MIIAQKRSKLAALLVTSVVVTGAIVLNWLYQPAADAADMSKFDAGNIMSDAVMSNKNSMSVQQIQAFLDSKNACNNTDIYKAAWYPTVSYSIKDGKFVCMAQESFNGESAAQIIWQAGQDYNINPQVLIVLLQKEQGLVTDTWPNSRQYQTATGYGCPDTAPCDAQYYGLKNQLRQAANLFRTVLNGGWSNYPVGNVYIQYNPSASCGGSVVNVKNRATSALYRYTPYQPNDATKSVALGVTAPCGAYGNKNFWWWFTDWFGGTQGSGGFTSLDDPRWMQIRVKTTKINAYTQGNVGPEIQVGAQAKFIDKIYINGVWIARTQWDYDNGNVDGFRADDLTEIQFTSLPETWMTIPSSTNKVDPLRDKVHEKADAQTLVKFVDQITIGGKTYYRTEYEKSQNRSRVFPVESLANLQLFNFQSPRLMINRNPITKINVLTGANTGSIDAGEIRFYNKLINYDGTLYAQLETDNGSYQMVNSRGLEELTGNLFPNTTDAKYMRLATNTIKYDIVTGNTVGPSLAKDTDAFFVDRVRVNGVWFARTKWDRDNDNQHGIPLQDLADITTTSITKTEYTIKNNTKKVDPITGVTYENITKGAKAFFVDKITVLGKEYYRTEWEVNQNQPRFIPADDLSL